MRRRQHTHFTEEQLKELQYLQGYFCTDFERSCKMMRLIGLQLLATVDKAESLEDIKEEADIILEYFKGLK